jgi:hypothetical protein
MTTSASEGLAHLGSWNNRRVVGYVRPDSGGTRVSHCGFEVFGVLEQEMDGGDIWTIDPTIDLNAHWSPSITTERYMRVSVVRMIKTVLLCGRVKDRESHHLCFSLGWLPFSVLGNLHGLVRMGTMLCAVPGHSITHHKSLRIVLLSVQVGVELLSPSAVFENEFLVFCDDRRISVKLVLPDGDVLTHAS